MTERLTNASFGVIVLEKLHKKTRITTCLRSTGPVSPYTTGHSIDIPSFCLCIVTDESATFEMPGPKPSPGGHGAPCLLQVR